MFVQSTHYGNCILPSGRGPCVCGDPCYIGPEGDGCDYALYTPESKESLVADRVIFLTQINELERTSPKHPQLGQWKARLSCVNHVLEEIADAEAAAAEGKLAPHPRAGLVPEDGPIPPSSVSIPPQRGILERRRNAARNNTSKFQRKHIQQPPQILGRSLLDQAETILQEIEAARTPMTVAKLVRKLGVDVNAVYNCAQIRDCMAHHSQTPPALAEQIMERQLKVLLEAGKETSDSELAERCGISQQNFMSHPEWQERLRVHNRAVRTEQERRQVEQHLQDLIAAGQSETVPQFADSVQISIRRLHQIFPDIVTKVRQQHRVVQAQARQMEERQRIYVVWNMARQTNLLLSPFQLALQAQVTMKTLRFVCPELIAQMQDKKDAKKQAIETLLGEAFAAIEQRGELAMSRDFAATAGLWFCGLQTRFPAWKDRLDAYNCSVMKKRLEDAWERMEHADVSWTIKQFAQEVGIDAVTLRRTYPAWLERVKTKRASEKCHH